MLNQINKKGFTLLEVIIALVLFTIISISLMNIVDTTMQYRKRTTRNIKEIKVSRNALQIIRKDIRNIFYIQDMNASAHILFREQKQKSQAQIDETTGLLNTKSSDDEPNELQRRLNEFEEKEIGPYLSEKIYFSGGITGKQNSLLMASLSYIPNQENTVFSDQNIVSYYLKPCKSREKDKKESNCLWRQFSTVIDQDRDNLKHYDEFVLLEKVKVFQLSYYNRPENNWMKEWKTGETDRKTLPSAIHIKIEFEDRRQQSVRREIYLPLHQQLVLPL